MAQNPLGDIKPFDFEKWQRESAPKPRGGARPGAGRPRRESLSPRDLRFLAELVKLTDHEHQAEELVAKLLRIADRVEMKGR